MRSFRLPFPRRKSPRRMDDGNKWRTATSAAGSHLGANWIRPDSLKRKWRAVVDQMATLKADHILVAESNLVLAA